MGSPFDNPLTLLNHLSTCREIIALIDRDSGEDRPIVALLSGAPDLAESIVKSANSVAVGWSRRVTELSRAVLVLGRSRLREIVRGELEYASRRGAHLLGELRVDAPHDPLTTGPASARSTIPSESVRNGDAQRG